VLDFAYTDRGRGGLNLSSGDSLLERLYCFEDLEDDKHLRRVILKVHTLRKWGERGDKLYERASKVTAVKFLYADWNPSPFVGQDGILFKTKFVMNQRSELKLLPVSEKLQEQWRDLYRKERYHELEWEWRNPDSMPSADTGIKNDGSSLLRCEVNQVYNEVRAAIELGEGLFHRGAMVTDKCMQGYDGLSYSPWKEVKGLYQVFPLFLSIPRFLLPSPSPSHTSHHLGPSQYHQVVLFFENH
jgi:hypothetical protein